MTQGPKLDESALDPTCDATPAGLLCGRTSGPPVASSEDTLLAGNGPLTCLCTDRGWDRCSALQNGVRGIQGSQGKGVTQTGEHHEKEGTPFNSTSSSQQHSTFPLLSQFCRKASPPKTRKNTHQRGRHESWHFKVKPKKYFEHKNQCYLGGDILYSMAVQKHPSAMM